MKKLQKIKTADFSVFENDIVKELQSCFGGALVNSTLTGGYHYNQGYRYDTVNSESTLQPDGTSVTDLSNWTYCTCNTN